MESTAAPTKLAVFDQHRPRLFGLAYRMLGTREDADEVVQDAYVRWHTADEAEVRSPEAWLVSAVTRLSIDRLRRASRRRETYIGPWLPEPLLISRERSPQESAELTAGLSIAFLAMLERLSPTERAVFLLYEIFECGYPEIARITGRSEAAVRQMISRARSRVRADKKRFDADSGDKAELIRKFVAASNAGDENALTAIFADDLRTVSDGGGIATAARKVVVGARRIARFFHIQSKRQEPLPEAFLVKVNGETALLRMHGGEPLILTAFVVKDGRITELYNILNPEKLAIFRQPADKISLERLSQ